MKIGDQIRLSRHERGLTQEDVAREAPIDQSYLAQIEVGKRTPSAKMLLRLARVLDVPIGLLRSSNLSEDQFLAALRSKGDEAPNPYVAETLGQRYKEEPSLPLLHSRDLETWDWSDLHALTGNAKRFTRLDGVEGDSTSFAVWVDSLELRTEAAPNATRVVVSPMAPIRSGDTVIVQSDFGPAVRRYVDEGGRRELRGLPDQRVVIYGQQTRMFRVVAFVTELR